MIMTDDQREVMEDRLYLAVLDLLKDTGMELVDGELVLVDADGHHDGLRIDKSMAAKPPEEYEQEACSRRYEPEPEFLSQGQR